MSTRHVPEPSSSSTLPAPAPAPATRRGRRVAVSAAAVAVTLVGSATAASAFQAPPPPSRALVVAGTLHVLAGPGHANAVTVFQQGAAEIRVRDALRPIVAQFPCQNVAANLVRCPAATVQRISVQLGDRDDTGRNATNRPSTLSGGTGNDVLSGALARDDFRGGLGVDRVSYQDRAAAVSIRVFDSLPNDGQAGENDNVRPDVEDVVGGEGNDRLIGSSAANRLEGRNGNDRLEGLDGNDVLVGGNGNDVLVGGNGSDRLEGLDGNDALVGGNGNDVLVGGNGSDRADGGPQIDFCSAETRINCP